MASGGTFGGVAVGELKSKAATQEEKPAGLFGAAKAPLFAPISGGTFGGVKLPEAPKQEEKKPTSLFGSVQPAATSGSLFGNLNTVQKQPEEPAKKGSLFGGNPAPIGGDSN